VSSLSSAHSFPSHLNLEFFTMADSEKVADVAQVEAPKASEVPEAPQGYQYAHIDPEVQRRVVRKLDWHIMPLVMALCKLYSVKIYL
jgi:hypothetical protein